MSTRILTVFTGGTISSTTHQGIINTDATTHHTLIDLFQKQYSNHYHVSFTCLQPLQLLSENMAPPAWSALITALESSHLEEYDGIIITHGTDTLSFSACALSYYFHRLKKPILLVSSNYPLDNPQANGLENFICAVEFILQVNEPGVFVPYKNPKQIMHIHRGIHLAASLQLSGDFISVQNKHYMVYDRGRFSELNPSTHTPAAAIPLRAVFSDNILLIKPYPGLDYRHICLDHAVAILHDLYHSGTACVTKQWGENYSLVKFIQRCAARGIPVYLAPAVKTDAAYQSTRALLDFGAMMLWNLSLEAAYVKLALAYGNFTDQQQINDFLTQNIALEAVHWADLPEENEVSQTCIPQRP